LFLTSGCNRAIRNIYPENPSQRSIPVYVISLGWHTGIALEHVYLKEHLPDHPKMPQSKYLMFGWGDGKYYPHPDPGAGLLIRAALLPTQSVLHVVGIDQPVKNYFPSSRIVRIMVHESGAERLAEFIGNHFEMDEDGNPVFTDEGLYRTSAFFEAKPTYFFPRTSNRWVAQALRRTGYPITPFYALTADNVMKQASKYGKLIQ
ncbi:MAG: DUF2459 domain-containing protein, partial [Balneolaceae bacterium]|nr:DUF2459 domain-containing protein [Balneolaceae bacterium]